MPQPQFPVAQLIVNVVVFAVAVHAILLSVAYLIYVERKIASYVQDRIGPNRVGFDFGLPFLAKLKGCVGLGQPLADGLKFLLKEDYMPRGADKVLFTLAPVAIIIPALIGFAIIPWGGTWEIGSFTIFGWHVEGGPVEVAAAAVDVGVVYLIAVASIGIYGVVLGGWASNNKYSFLGGLRASAQMISYEVPMGLSLLAVLLTVGTLAPSGIIAHQREHGWLIFALPVPAFIFLICMLAESNRVPFDNAECESELVGGYHTEYSSMRFALFFLAEYAHLITSSAFFSLLFLGGWEIVPFVKILPAVGHGWVGLVIVLIKCGVFAGKVFTLVALFMVIRWTLPRLRYDQVMQRAWQGMIPLSLGVVVVTAVMIWRRWDAWWMMLLANAGYFALCYAVFPWLPRTHTNHKVPLIGSRYSPAPESA